MKNVWALSIFVLSSLASATGLEGLKQNSNAYATSLEKVRERHLASLFTVRRTVSTPLKSRDGLPIYLRNTTCQVAAQNHVFTFGQIPRPQLVAGESYRLLHVRNLEPDVPPGVPAHVRISLGSFYAHPRVLAVDCNLTGQESLEKLSALLDEVFEIHP